MSGYTKLFRKILQSTIWQEKLETKVVWITMLALKDADGNVLSSIPGLAHAAGVSIEATMAALEKFKSPDPFSSTKDLEGRRIKEIEGGWFVINHFKYLDELSLEDRRAYWALKKREARYRKGKLTRKINQRDEEHMRRLTQEAA